jgi:hypothetical protein
VAVGRASDAIVAFFADEGIDDAIATLLGGFAIEGAAVAVDVVPIVARFAGGIIAHAIATAAGACRCVEATDTVAGQGPAITSDRNAAARRKIGAVAIFAEFMEAIAANRDDANAGVTDATGTIDGTFATRAQRCTRTLRRCRSAARPGREGDARRGLRADNIAAINIVRRDAAHQRAAQQEHAEAKPKPTMHLSLPVRHG